MATPHTTIRLSPAIKARLERMAKLKGRKQAELLRRYVVMGLRRDEDTPAVKLLSEGIFE